MNVTETGGDLVENTPTAHTDVDRGLFDKLPLESQSSSLSSLITLASPGVVADSNGLFHGLGDHAENSFSIDGQPITDQQSKVFSNQIPVDSIQSLEVIEGAPPAEYGGKTSLVTVVTTRSGLGDTTPHGECDGLLRHLWDCQRGFRPRLRRHKWGNFISVNGLNTGRFLDPPEFTVLHDKGNEENIFDRVDFKLSDKNTIQLEPGIHTFLVPNSQYLGPATSNLHGSIRGCNGAAYTAGSFSAQSDHRCSSRPTDQRSQIWTFNIAPTWTRLLSSNAVLPSALWVRHDQYNYYPSNDPFSRPGAASGRNRLSAPVPDQRGCSHSLVLREGNSQHQQSGVTFQHTFLTENDNFGIVNPGATSGLHRAPHARLCCHTT